ncbi:MAG: LytTR family DNA-binding domain-containing protein [Bacteroidia bacterium]|nr:LytTR family DNA-binding domain-containing protein [Bacteroidia bacterium]
MYINCIAVDDEPLALDLIKDYIQKVPFLNMLSNFSNGIETLDFLKKSQVDLLFLDIQMNDLTGIQLIKVLKQKPLVIFTTAYPNYAVEGYELDIVDYLLKPISFERFVKAVDKVYEKLQTERMFKSETREITIANPRDDFFFIKTEFRLEKVKFADILYIEGMGDYLRMVTNTRRIMTLQNFKRMEEILPEDRFCRVHKSFIVSLEKIESIERNRIKIADKLIPISDSYKKSFYDYLGKKKLM